MRELLVVFCAIFVYEATGQNVTQLPAAVKSKSSPYPGNVSETFFFVAIGTVVMLVVTLLLCWLMICKHPDEDDDDLTRNNNDNNVNNNNNTNNDVELRTTSNHMVFSSKTHSAKEVNFVMPGDRDVKEV